jgi:hypothetical protein
MDRTRLRSNAIRDSFIRDQIDEMA